MPNAFEFCLPTAAKVVPDGPDWLHEIKYDGYRLRVERSGKDVRLLTRNGHNWTSRFPWIVEAALKNREQQFVVDGEAVVLGVDGVSDFNALHSRKCDHEVQLYAFDILALGGEDRLNSPPRSSNFAKSRRTSERSRTFLERGRSGRLDEACARLGGLGTCCRTRTDLPEGLRQAFKY
ncbi:DNA ligase [Bradyrhizobium sp. 62B]|nr:DNA ligase [Bradyrhizobium sp. 62B]